MRCLIFIGGLGTGGAERQMAQLADGLARRRHEVFLVTLYPGGQNWEWLRDRGSVRLISLFDEKAGRKVAVGSQMGWAAIPLRRLICRERVSVVYSALYMSNLIAWLAVRGLRGVGLVWGIRASSMELNWQRSLPFRLCARVSPSVPLMIANSQAGLRDHIAAGYRTRAHAVIPNGISVQHFQPHPNARSRVRAEWGLADQEKLIGLVGRLDPKKGHRTFLQAATQLARIRENVKFVCVGDGAAGYRRELHALGHEVGLNGRLIWAGERRDMPAVYSALDIATSSSLYGEGFSNVIGEAMACGVPCVVTDVGDSRWIVAETGIVIKPGSPEELCRGWLDLLSKNPGQMGELAALARHRIEGNFSVAPLLVKTESMLTSLATPKLSPSVTL